MKEIYQIKKNKDTFVICWNHNFKNNFHILYIKFKIYPINFLCKKINKILRFY